MSFESLIEAHKYVSAAMSKSPIPSASTPTPFPISQLGGKCPRESLSCEEKSQEERAVSGRGGGGEVLCESPRLREQTGPA